MFEPPLGVYVPSNDFEAFFNRPRTISELVQALAISEELQVLDTFRRALQRTRRFFEALANFDALLVLMLVLLRARNDITTILLISSSFGAYFESKRFRFVSKQIRQRIQ